MIALRRDVFPLPHGEADGETLLKNIKGINYLIFDHNAIRNRELARNISELGGTAETLYLEKGGVIIQIHDNDTAGDTGKAGTKQAPHAETQAPAKK
jgi:hypothetical protein